MKILLYIFSIIIILLSLFLACSDNPFKISIDNIKIDLKFLNLDSALRNSSDEELLNLKSKFSKDKLSILDYTVSYCIGGSLRNDTSYINSVRRFHSNNFILSLERAIKKKHGDFSPEKKQLLIAFRRLKAFFPKEKTPSCIYFINSYFSASVFCKKILYI